MSEGPNNGEKYSLKCEDIENQIYGRRTDDFLNPNPQPFFDYYYTPSPFTGIPISFVGYSQYNFHSEEVVDSTQETNNGIVLNAAEFERQLFTENTNDSQNEIEEEENKPIENDALTEKKKLETPSQQEEQIVGIKIVSSKKKKNTSSDHISLPRTSYKSKIISIDEKKSKSFKKKKKKLIKKSMKRSDEEEDYELDQFIEDVRLFREEEKVRNTKEKESSINQHLRNIKKKKKTKSKKMELENTGIFFENPDKDYYDPNKNHQRTKSEISSLKMKAIKQYKEKQKQKRLFVHDQDPILLPYDFLDVETKLLSSEIGHFARADQRERENTNKFEKMLKRKVVSIKKREKRNRDFIIGSVRQFRKKKKGKKGGTSIQKRTKTEKRENRHQKFKAEQSIRKFMERN